MKKREPMWIIFIAGVGAGMLNSRMDVSQPIIWLEWLALSGVIAFVSMFVFKMIVEFQD